MPAMSPAMKCLKFSMMVGSAFCAYSSWKPPWCGVTMTFSMSHSGLSFGSGSVANTSSAAPATSDSLTGGRQTVLMERGGVGYTPCFTKVGLDTDTAPGTLLPVIITGRNGDHLTGIAA